MAKKKPAQSKEGGVLVDFNDVSKEFAGLVGKTVAEAKALLGDDESVKLHAFADVFVADRKRQPPKTYKLKSGDRLVCENPDPARVEFSGKEMENLELVGKTVGDVVKNMLPKKWKIPSPAAMSIGGEEVGSARVLGPGQTLILGYPVVKVTCAGNGGGYAELIGKSVAYARKNLSETHNIPKGSDAFLNGELVERDKEKTTILKQGDELEFNKEDGSKG